MASEQQLFIKPFREVHLQHDLTQSVFQCAVNNLLLEEALSLSLSLPLFQFISLSGQTNEFNLLVNWL